MNYETYAAMLDRHGSTRRDRMVEKSKRDTLRMGPDSPAYKEVEIEGIPHHMMIISSTVTNQKIIRTMPGDNFEIGKIMLFSKSHWLITERDADDEITVRGKIELCNRSIQWQNHETGEIITRWAVVDKPYFSNLNEDVYMTISSREFQVKIPYDEESALLDVGKRLMMEQINGKPKTYRVTCVDAMTERYDWNDAQTGFLVLNLEQDQHVEEQDNAEKMLCDYQEVKQTPKDGEVIIKYAGEPKVRICGRGKIFKATVDGKPLPGCTWSLSVDDKTLETKVYLANSVQWNRVTGESCRVCAEDNAALNGATVTLTVVAPDGKSTDSIAVKVVDV